MIARASKTCPEFMENSPIYFSSEFHYDRISESEIVPSQIRYELCGVTSGTMAIGNRQTNTATINYLSDINW